MKPDLTVYNMNGAAVQLRRLNQDVSYYNGTSMGLRSIVVSLSVCASVCLSDLAHNSKTARKNFTKFLCRLPGAVARSSCNGVVLCYVLPVSRRMTSCFHTIEPYIYIYIFVYYADDKPQLQI